jgi:hypothetical protein
LISTLQRAQDAAGRLNVRSALNPFLWLCGIVIPVLLCAAFVFARVDSLRSFCAPLIYTALALAIITTVVGVGFAIFHPERLQSEDFQIRQQALLMFQQGSPPQVIDPVNIVAIANPALAQTSTRGLLE